jgi:hypothetical protein
VLGQLSFGYRNSWDEIVIEVVSHYTRSLNRIQRLDLGMFKTLLRATL